MSKPLEADFGNGRQAWGAAPRGKRWPKKSAKKTEKPKKKQDDSSTGQDGGKPAKEGEDQ